MGRIERPPQLERGRLMTVIEGNLKCRTLNLFHDQMRALIQWVTVDVSVGSRVVDFTVQSVGIQ